MSYVIPAIFAKNKYVECLFGCCECRWTATQSLQYDRCHLRLLFTGLEDDLGSVVFIVLVLVFILYYDSMTEGEPIDVIE
jgi:hypothetical protein